MAIQSRHVPFRQLPLKHDLTLVYTRWPAFSGGACPLEQRTAVDGRGATQRNAGYAGRVGALIDDFAVICPTLLIGGVQLWRRKALGYVTGAGLLLQYGVLALGLIPGLIAATPIDVAGLGVILGTAGLCLAPLAFFVRGAMLAQRLSIQ